MKKWEHTKKIAVVSLILLVILFIIVFFKPYYRTESRNEKINNFKGISDERPLGWLRVQGTNIDFPIMYYDDVNVSNAKYEMGWNYLEDRELVKKTTIFSHNVLNVSSTPLITEKSHKRFEQLLSFIYTNFVEKNKYIQYTIGKNDYLYKIYGISFQKEKDLNYRKSDLSNEELKKYIKRTQDNSYFKFDVDVKDNDYLLTLVTCTRFFGETTEYSFVVDARMVRKNERVKNYKVTEKKSYKKIKKTLEGDVEDEKI